MARTKQEQADDEAPDEAVEAPAPKPAHQGAARPNDLPIGGKAPDNSTLATRAKRVAEASNKAVRSADTK